MDNEIAVQNLRIIIEKAEWIACRNSLNMQKKENVPYPIKQGIAEISSL